jgi:hypothetical protein
MDYLKVGKATDLLGKERFIYRLFEILPGFLAFGTLFALVIFSYFKPVLVAFFIIAFNVYWLLLVLYLSLHLIAAYRELKRNSKINWQSQCDLLAKGEFSDKQEEKCLARQGLKYTDLWQLVILPTYNEDISIIRTALDSILKDDYDKKKMIIVLALEERAGDMVYEKAEILKQEYQDKFTYFKITFHPDNIEGELKGKGANQAWAISKVKRDIIDQEKIDYNKILVSVFDIDTVIKSGYFHVLAYKFLSVSRPYRSSYQPIPVYHNNIWSAPFFSRVAAASNTFWQMMMQIRPEMLVTYSSHSMTFKALVDIGFWSTKMVSEDSRIFWHCLLYYQGDYRVEPLYFPVSMDVTADKNFYRSAISLYKQQRRWAWGAENIPYLIFNTIKKWKKLEKKKFIYHIFIQLYGFHSWSTNALIIAAIGWMPLLLGGERFKTTVLSGNLPSITSTLMSLAMVGLILSAIISALLLPKRPKNYPLWKKVLVLIEWIFVPFTIVLFGAIPCLDAQLRLLKGKYMGFWVSPKERK